MTASPATFDIVLRPIEPGDYEYVIARIDAWWGGRSMSPLLPRLFFEHFGDTSVVAAEPGGRLVGFLVGFVSRTDPTTAYIHFVGVDPECRGGVGRRLYEWFFERVASLGCASVSCVTSPINTGSRAFHQAMGFSEVEIDDYDEIGRSTIKFHRSLDGADRRANLELVTIVVDEYDPAIDFFVDVLDFELVEDSASETNDGRAKRWVVVRPRGAVTGILLARADGEAQSAIVGNQTAGRVGHFLRVADFDAALARLTAAGVEIVSPTRSMSYGRVTVFLDVVGNRWDLLGR